MTMRTRFAPSPTGFLHIGGARTALFCHLQARHSGGKWILRIEDTDRERSSREAVEVIIEGLKWLGLDADEGPVFQSENTSLHLAAAEHLLESDKAYRCYCTREELDDMRALQRERKEKPRYDGRCAKRTDTPLLPYVVRFKTPQEGKVGWDDQIQGRIEFPNEELDDLILVRSDGSPTYNLAVVTDDHALGITHVIRGEDHTSNTPRQIHLYEALDWPVPIFAHMPLLHGSDGGKLSKRHGAVSVLQYRDEGFLPEAVNNYLVRLGWSHGEQEIFSSAEMIEHFDVQNVGRSAAIFNREKLEWLNGHHIRQCPTQRLATEVIPHLEKMGISNPDPQLVEAFVPLLRERAKTLVEMAEKSLFLFVDEVTSFQEKAVKKHCKAAILPPLGRLVEGLEALERWSEDNLQAAFDQVLAEAGIKVGKLAQPVRIALTGGPVSPGIHDVLLLLGREKSLQRLKAGLAHFHEAAS
ncbi:MAG: glutamate--tRNA ligase [Magnetococcales bacterium]|nr:glutamate--tRNA ligase [Magnetococcales bacterium]